MLAVAALPALVVGAAVTLLWWIDRRHAKMYPRDRVRVNAESPRSKPSGRFWSTFGGGRG